MGFREPDDGRIHVGSYDARRPLVIDPTIVLATYVGGGGTDQAFAIALDASANVYLTGNTNSADFPTTVGAFSANTAERRGRRVRREAQQRFHREGRIRHTSGNDRR